MKRSRVLLAALVITCTILLAQAQPPQLPAATQPAAAPTQATAPALEDDRFPALRESADRLKAVYEKLDAENMDEVERVLKTRRCQIARIGGLLDRTLDGMRQWHQAEMTYWRKWAEAEQQRVDGQKKSLAGMEADQQRVKELIATEAKDHDELLRKKANLEKYGKRTQDIVKDIDALILDIKDSEARLDQAQKQYDEITVQVNNMSASISARLIDMRQQLNRIEAYGLQMASFYEDKRKDAQEVCNLKQPNTTRTPLPKNARPIPQKP